LFTEEVSTSLVSHFPSWSSSVKAEEEDILHFVDDRLQREREIQLDLFAEDIKKSFQKDLSNMLSSVLNKAEPMMWKSNSELIYKEKEHSEKKLHHILQEFGCKEGEAYLKRTKQQALKSFEGLRTVIKERVCNLDNIMMQRYTSLFEMDKEGIPKRWNPGDNIKGFWILAKKEAETLLDLYSYIRLNESDYQLVYLKTNPRDISVDLSDSQNIDDEKIILTRTDAERLLQRFRDLTFSSYKNAEKEMERLSSQGHIPIYIFALLVILGFNEMWTVISIVISSPFMFMFAVLLGGIAFFVWYFSLTPYVNTMISLMVHEGRSYIKYKFNNNVGNKQKKNE